MDVLCCPDNNYVMPTDIMMISLLENNRTEEITFHIMANLSQKNQEILTNTAKRYSAQIKFYTIPHNGIKFKIGHSLQRALPLSTYWRLYATEILPCDINKIIYLDGDIIIRGSLSALWKMDLTNIAIAGVPDENLNNGSILTYNKLQYPQRKGYFNAGVLLINLQKWRQDAVFEEVKKYVESYTESFSNHDQDILNFILQDDKIEIDLTYNFQAGFLLVPKQRKISWEYYEQIEKYAANPIVLHFNTCIKPWFKECDHPYKCEFIKYKRLSEWKDVSLNSKSLSFHIKRLIKIILVKTRIVRRPYWSKEWAYTAHDLKYIK